MAIKDAPTKVGIPKATLTKEEQEMLLEKAAAHMVETDEKQAKQVGYVDTRDVKGQQEVLKFPVQCEVCGQEANV